MTPMVSCSHGFPNAPAFPLDLLPSEMAFIVGPLALIDYLSGTHGVRKLDEGSHRGSDARQQQPSVVKLRMGSHGMRTHLASLTNYPLNSAGLTVRTRAATNRLLMAAGI